MSKQILPPATIGIIGGGQLGRMMALAAKYMGYKIAVLDPTPDCPTAQVADISIAAPYDDIEAIKQLTDVSDVITYEFENVSLNSAVYIASQGKLPQGSIALKVTQNREQEKKAMSEAALPVPPYVIVHQPEALEDALMQVTLPAVLKTCSGGYDGKGQMKLESKEQVKEAVDFVAKNGTCILEQWVHFDREISVVFTRAQNGEISYFPIAENEHLHHILYRTMVPAAVNQTVADKAIGAAGKLAEKLEVVGTFAIEMFVKDDEIYLNEMAPRPHNSGHYTIEACNVSQFAQHIRAICQLPLIPVELLQPAVMVNILGQHMDFALQQMRTDGNSFIHIYGKEQAKENRKMGHITYLGETLETAKAKQHTYQK